MAFSIWLGSTPSNLVSFLQIIGLSVFLSRFSSSWGARWFYRLSSDGFGSISPDGCSISRGDG
jgi:hypothetical protein